MSITHADRLRCTIDRLKKELAEVKAERDRLILSFSHIHVASDEGSDACLDCGFDLRNKIHSRI